MSDENKIDAYIFEVKDRERDSFEEWALVIEDTLITSGTWMSGTDSRIEGIIYGLELAKFPSNIIQVKIIDPELKKSLDVKKLMEHANK